jgi:hypothetical protein
MLRVASAIATILVVTASAQAQDRPTKVRNDRARVEADGFWIYNDLPRGIAQAKESDKPLLVVFRCIPCEACAQLDEKVVERDPLIQELLAKFVCVRVVHANGMDLSLFQFDYDQSWAAFFLNANMTIYGRYGTRSHQTESDDDVSLEGFGKALAAALEVHREYPRNKEMLKGKRGSESAVKVPEELPALRGKYKSKLDYEGQVVQSCIHCHQVGEALRGEYRSAAKPIPDSILYPYPNPKVLGLTLDPKERAKVTEVARESCGKRAGFQEGDAIVKLSGQLILSTADIQWVLHNTAESATLDVEVERDGKTIPLKLTLEKGWRKRDNISWRATSWELRRMVTGGLVLDDLSDSDRRSAGLSESALALRIKHVGQYGEHAAGKKAGFNKDDILVAVDGRSNRMTEGDLMAYLLNAKRAGDRVPMTVQRGRERIELNLPMQ